MGMKHPLTVDHSGHRQRLKARFEATGLDGFAPHEIIELVLTYSIPRINVNSQAHALLDRFGSLSGVLDASPEALCEVPGIGRESAILLKLIPALFSCYATDRLKDSALRLHTVSAMEQYLKALFYGLAHERVYALYFDNRMSLRQCSVLSDGVVNSAPVTIRRLAEESLTLHAACVVIAHNHPGGLAVPSASDCEVTQTIADALAMINVPLLEHFVVSDYRATPILKDRRLVRPIPVLSSETADAREAFLARFYEEMTTAGDADGALGVDGPPLEKYL